jgi:hypothetical protein
MKSENSYDIKQFKKDISTLQKQTKLVVEKSVQRVISKTTSENAFIMSFDEAEVIPFGVGNSGSITVTATDIDPVDVAMLASMVEQDVTTELYATMARGMKGLMR